MWSWSAIKSPGRKVGFKPPAALVMIRISAPRRCKVRTGKRDLLERVPLVEVGPPAQHGDGHAFERAADELAGVSGDRRDGEVRDLGVRHDGRVLDLVGERPEARSEDDPDARHDREATPQAGGRLPNSVRQ